MPEAGIVVRAPSALSFHASSSTKKYEKTTVCVDYCAPNHFTGADRRLLSEIMGVLDGLKGSTALTSSDLFSENL